MIDPFWKRLLARTPTWVPLVSLMTATIPPTLALHLVELKVWWLVRLSGIDHLFPSMNLVSIDEVKMMVDIGAWAIARRVSAWLIFSAVTCLMLMLVLWLSWFILVYLRDHAQRFDRSIERQSDGLIHAVDQVSMLLQMQENLDHTVRHMGAKFRKLSEEIDEIRAALPVVASSAPDAQPQGNSMGDTGGLEHEFPERKREPERERDLSNDLELDLDF